jgi:hypothetical protein
MNQELYANLNRVRQGSGLKTMYITYTRATRGDNY